jgi:hypothetical protein
MPHDNAALMREAANRLYCTECGGYTRTCSYCGPLVTRLRAAADALAAGGEAVTVEGAWEALDRSVSSDARFANDKRVGSAMATLADLFIEIRDSATDNATVNAARRAEEPRHD